MNPSICSVALRSQCVPHQLDFNFRNNTIPINN